MRASKPKRIYAPRIISDHIMVQEDFERLHKFLLETEGLPEVSDDMRELVEEERPELVHKLPPKVADRARDVDTYQETNNIIAQFRDPCLP